MFSKFLLGSLHVDDNVREILGRTPLDLIARHAVCDFGCTPPRTWKLNEMALTSGDEIISEYPVDPTNKKLGTIRVTTEAGWGNTHVVFVKRQPNTRKKKDDSAF